METEFKCQDKLFWMTPKKFKLTRYLDFEYIDFPLPYLITFLQYSRGPIKGKNLVRKARNLTRSR